MLDLTKRFIITLKFCNLKVDSGAGYFFQLFIMYPKMYLYKRLKDAKIHIDRSYAEPINLDTISENAYLSKYHFLRLFKKAYGITPHQYVVNKRIEKAKELLIEGLSVNDVCLQIGFDSVPSFSILFKRQTSLSPTEFRRQENNKSNFR